MTAQPAAQPAAPPAVAPAGPAPAAARPRTTRPSFALPFGLAALLGLSYVALLVSSLAGQVWPFAIAAVLSLLLDWLMRRTRYRRLLALLARNDASISWRFFIRRVLVVVLLFRAGELSHFQLAVVVCCVVLLHVAFIATGILGGMIAARRLRRIETRNLDIAGSEVVPNRWPRLRAIAGATVLHTETLLVAALVWAALTGSYALVVPGAVAMLVIAFVIPGALLVAVRELRRMPKDADRMVSAQSAVNRLAPLAILYFSGGTASVYQVNTWLSTMERLDRPILVLLRERRYLNRLNETRLPVLCMPFAADLMNFELPTARVALYVANVGKNIHLLRVPTMKSAFIGHGDSDKTASFNPFTKVYDEVWVAGAAGRERYGRADIGVRDEEIVEVGRPQLDRIEHYGDRPVGTPFTVLYAPTWEGWVEDPYATSLVLLGPGIVAQLLATPDVRVVYKPHPLTGRVSPAAAAADAEIIRMVQTAGTPHVNVLEGIELYDCFNESDALISDISSVVSDYLRSNKPYFVTNPAGYPDDAFREENPSAGAAYLIGPHVSGLAAGLQDARTSDSQAAARRQVSTYILGDPEVDALARFERAIDDLAAKSQASQLLVGAEARDHLGAVDRDQDDLLALDLDESAATSGAQRDNPVDTSLGDSPPREET